MKRNFFKKCSMIALALLCVLCGCQNTTKRSDSQTKQPAVEKKSDPVQKRKGNLALIHDGQPRGRRIRQSVRDQRDIDARACLVPGNRE